jgi:hypothetical protein
LFSCIVLVCAHAHWVVDDRRPAPSASTLFNNSHCPLGLSRTLRFLARRHENIGHPLGLAFRSTTSARVKLIEHICITHQLGSMTSRGDAPSPEEEKQFSVLSTPESFGTPMARTHLCTARSRDR